MCDYLNAVGVNNLFRKLLQVYYHFYFVVLRTVLLFSDIFDHFENLFDKHDALKLINPIILVPLFDSYFNSLLHYKYK